MWNIFSFNGCLYGKYHKWGISRSMPAHAYLWNLRISKNLHKLHELKSNQTITKPIILGGHLEVDGICSGGGGVVIQILELGEM